jgi:hypothetical protein
MLNQLLYHNDLFSIFAIVGGSFLVLSIMSLIDGWYKVSRKYRRQNVTSGKLFPFAYMYGKSEQVICIKLKLKLLLFVDFLLCLN